MLLPAILAIISVILLVFLESFLLALLNFRLTMILFLFLFRKIDWKLLFFPLFVLSFMFDVVKNFPLGTNFLVLSVVFGLLLIFSLFLSVESGFTTFLVRSFLFTLYYILLLTVPSFLIEGSFGILCLRDVLLSLSKGVLSALLLLLLDRTYANFRKRGGGSQILLK